MLYLKNLQLAQKLLEREYQENTIKRKPFEKIFLKYELKLLKKKWYNTIYNIGQPINIANLNRSG